MPCECHCQKAADGKYEPWKLLAAETLTIKSCETICGFPSCLDGTNAYLQLPLTLHEHVHNKHSADMREARVTLKDNCVDAVTGEILDIGKASLLILAANQKKTQDKHRIRVDRLLALSLPLSLKDKKFIDRTLSREKELTTTGSLATKSIRKLLQANAFREARAKTATDPNQPNVSKRMRNRQAKALRAAKGETAPDSNNRPVGSKRMRSLRAQALREAKAKEVPAPDDIALLLTSLTVNNRRGRKDPGQKFLDEKKQQQKRNGKRKNSTTEARRAEHNERVAAYKASKKAKKEAEGGMQIVPSKTDDNIDTSSAQAQQVEGGTAPEPVVMDTEEDESRTSPWEELYD